MSALDEAIDLLGRGRPLMAERARAELAALRAERDALKIDRDAAVEVYMGEIKALNAMVDGLRAALVAAKREHWVCEDTYYSCEKLRRPAEECDCGADEHNAAIERALERRI